jgi:hypothetical protein
MAFETVFHAAAQRIEVWWNGACRRSVDCVACRETSKAQFLVGKCQRRIRERERELPRAEKPCDGPPCLAAAANPGHRDRGRSHNDWSSRDIGSCCEWRVSVTFAFHTIIPQYSVAQTSRSGLARETPQRRPHLRLIESRRTLNLEP